MSPFTYYYSYFVLKGFAVIVYGFTIFKNSTKKTLQFDSFLHFSTENPII